MNDLYITEPPNRSITLTLCLFMLLLVSLMTARAAGEPLKEEGIVDGPVAWPGLRQPGLSRRPTEPLSSSAVRTSSAEAENVEFVGHIGGPTKAVFVHEDHAYIGEGGALTILDISNRPPLLC